LPVVRSTARGTFDIDMTPGPPELQGAVDRFDFRKTFYGDLQAEGAGLMLSCGDPQAGTAGYVAIETVGGSLGDQRGGFALQQIGMMRPVSRRCSTWWFPGPAMGRWKVLPAHFTSPSKRTARIATNWSTTSKRAPRRRTVSTWPHLR
jgi:hypothetical protein